MLFQQGNGSIGEGGWHLGEITKVDNGDSGSIYYGKHSKGESDGKGLGYAGYDPVFEKYEARQLRVFPNVFDILNQN